MWKDKRMREGSASYKLRGIDLAGFDIYGERQDDGKILIGHSGETLLLDAFPQEVEVLGYTFELEFIRENGKDDSGAVLEWAKNVPADDPRLRICWGVYV